jgi:uncharacterized caspase-like protein
VRSCDAQLTLIGAAGVARKGTAYIITIGLNKYANNDYDLRYAFQDAKAFANDLRQKQEQLKTFSNVEVIPLLNENATKTNILRAFQILSGSDPKATPPGTSDILASLHSAQPEDAIFVYFAGHGTSIASHFYLLPYDFGYQGKRDELSQDQLNVILSHSISDEELRSAFEGIDAGKLVLVIDACNSGQALDEEEKRRGPMNSKGLAQLAYEKGMYILTASQSFQQALEVDRLGHGLLTFALVEEGLDTSAAMPPGNTDLGVREWLDYAARRVPEMLQTILDQSRSLDRAAVHRREPDSSPLIIAKRSTEPDPNSIHYK